VIPQPPAREAPPAQRWKAAVLMYGQPRMLSMLALGFSAGLPWMLYFQTLSAWLRQVGTARATIGLIALVGLPYTVKFLWAPIVDRWRLPLLGGVFGQRRGWMLLAQLGIAAGLAGIALTDPVAHLGSIVGLALLVAFSGATQDIVIDAWRIETSPAEMQGAMVGGYQFGYRFAIQVGSTGALWMAGGLGWAMSYGAMAVLALVGIITTLCVNEPQRVRPQASIYAERRVVEWVERRSHWPPSLQAAGATLIGAVICPLTDFFTRFGWQLGLLVFGFVSTYRLTDYTAGTMANSFYVDIGYTLQQMGVAKLYGAVPTFLGIIAGGLVFARYGRTRSLLFGGVLIILSTLGYAVLAYYGKPSPLGLALVIGLDNLALGVHGTVLIAFMSTLTSVAYTATQYALLSSIYALTGKLVMSTSGFVVEAIGYPAFYVYAAALSLPALLLLQLLVNRRDLSRLQAVA
jgi:MFS transporter, PAT family, beta-lactamase induction signal transducer AmpG